MNNKKNDANVREGLVPKMARKMGEHSVDVACTWWINQPKVPESMKNKK